MAEVLSIIESGFEGTLINIECSLSNNLPTIVIVGVASRAVEEAKERLRSAFAASGLKLPRKRITLNLAPADIPKEGTSLDLGMAAAIMSVGVLDFKQKLTDIVLIGELSLGGEVRSVRGVIGKCLAAKRLGLKRFILPLANLEQAMMVPGIEVLAISDLSELFGYLNDSGELAFKTSLGSRYQTTTADDSSETIDIAEVIGQQRAKRAIEIAAVGQHNILLSGPPGVGKSMLAKTMASIMPRLDAEESLIVSHLHSLASQRYDKIITNRPIRSPHHSSSQIAILGGGHPPRPGEASLAHKGILFLDELPEFRRDLIESLRQPMEDRYITIARAKYSVSFPSNFILVATRNPCPCGFFGSHRACRCSPQELNRYNKKLSGPILDRIDLQVETDAIDNSQLLNNKNPNERSQTVAKRVSRARSRQLSRPGNHGKLNGELATKELKSVANLTVPAKELLDRAGQKLDLSARAYLKSLRIARTIADLNNSLRIEVEHIAEALQYRFKPVEAD